MNPINLQTMHQRVISLDIHNIKCQQSIVSFHFPLCSFSFSPRPIISEVSMQPDFFYAMFYLFIYFTVFNRYQYILSFFLILNFPFPSLVNYCRNVLFLWNSILFFSLMPRIGNVNSSVLWCKLLPLGVAYMRNIFHKNAHIITIVRFRFRHCNYYYYYWY